MNERRSRRGRGRLLAGLLLLAAASTVAGCKDTCTDVVCGPAPPVVTVTLLDVVMIDTTLILPTDTPDSVRTVDTTIGVIRVVTGPKVEVAQISGSDTVVFDTLQVSDDRYYKYDASHLPAGRFSLVARNDGRLAVQNNLELRQVDGCCAYPVVGVYTMQLR